MSDAELKDLIRDFLECRADHRESAARIEGTVNEVRLDAKHTKEGIERVEKYLEELKTDRTRLFTQGQNHERRIAVVEEKVRHPAAPQPAQPESRDGKDSEGPGIARVGVIVGGIAVAVASILSLYFAFVKDTHSGITADQIRSVVREELRTNDVAHRTTPPSHIP